MTIYRIWPATNGPAAANTTTLPGFVSGTTFTVTQGNMWFQGFWWWVGTSQSTAPVKCALWSQTGAGAGIVIPGTVVTSGALTASAWNYIPIATPVELSIYDQLVAAVTVNGNFPDTNNYWGSGQPGAAGITNGPLLAYSAQSGTAPNPWTTPQGCFAFSTTAALDASVDFPGDVSGTDNFWVDVQVSDVGPLITQQSYRLWPNKAAGDMYTSGDAALDYSIGTEIRISQSVSVQKIWVYVLPGSATLATACNFWAIGTGGLTGTSVLSNTTPAWKNPDGTAASAAAGGWMYADMGGATVAAGNYRVTVYNANGTSGTWGAKRFGYWGTSTLSQTTWGVPAAAEWGVNGLTSGPLYAPPTALASTTYEYNSALTANGNTTTEPGQSVFWQGPPNSFPNQYVDAGYQNYWVDIEVAILDTFIAGSTGALVYQANPGVVVIQIVGAAGHVAYKANAGRVDVAMSGPNGNLVYQANPGTFTISGGATVTGVTANLVYTAPPGLVAVNILGATGTVVYRAGAGSFTITSPGNVTVGGGAGQMTFVGLTGTLSITGNVVVAGVNAGTLRLAAPVGSMNILGPFTVGALTASDAPLSTLETEVV